MEIEEFNIQPQAGILGVFSRLNYKPWTAIAEFVDNSTASYLGHKQIMKFNHIKKLTVRVEYDSFKNTLTIYDDAYGMNKKDFERAILMDQKPDCLNGRNEFGMGLKTAASWFGNIWSVRSTQLGSDIEYYAEVNINKLRSEGLNTIEIVSNIVDKKTHGTIIKISEITKKIDAARTKEKIKNLLSSMYRRDINSGDIDIFFNEEKLFFKPYEVLTFRNNEWLKSVDFKFNFDGKEYHVDGNVGIMKDGSYTKAGFALFRYGRVIIGGPDMNYKPSAIFSQAQSQISLKLFGELNMEDFPVNQAKDGFVWDDGLEDAFLAKLKEEIKDYIQIAELSKKQRANEEQIDKPESESTQQDVQKLFDNLILTDTRDIINKETSSEEISNDVKVFKENLIEDNNHCKELISEQREYTIQLNEVKEKKFFVTWKITTNEMWFEYNEKTGEIFININHPFFKPYSLNKDFKNMLDCFVIAFVCSEEIAKDASLKEIGDNKYILPSTFRRSMNNILKKIGERRE